GGPAPGINGVIAAATIEAVKNGADVVGIYEGFRWLATGKLDDKHCRRLGIDDVSRIHGMGGSMLQTSRFNPTKSEKDMQNVLIALREAGISFLVTIGGDDTAYSSYSVSRRAQGAVRVAHVPKTIAAAPRRATRRPPAPPPPGGGCAWLPSRRPATWASASCKTWSRTLARLCAGT